MYADGATQTAETLSEAYGYLNSVNTEAMRSSAKGMRGFIVYNRQKSMNFAQIFFPVGATGIGRRTEQYATASFNGGEDHSGTLRYGALPWCLYHTTTENKGNQMRPIAFNLPASPGAIYWFKQAKYLPELPKEKYRGGWDVNYFDLTFNSYDLEAMSSGTYGDAISIKPIYTGEDNN